MSDFEKKPTFQDVCEAHDILDSVGIRTNEVRVTSCDSLLMEVEKDLVISRDPNKDTVATKASRLLMGDEVKVDTLTGPRTLEPEHYIEFANGIIEGRIETFPPLNDDESQKIIVLKQLIEVSQSPLTT